MRISASLALPFNKATDGFRFLHGHFTASNPAVQRIEKVMLGDCPAVPAEVGRPVVYRTFIYKVCMRIHDERFRCFHGMEKIRQREVPIGEYGESDFVGLRELIDFGLSKTGSGNDAVKSHRIRGKSCLQVVQGQRVILREWTIRREEYKHCCFLVSQQGKIE